MLLNKNLLLITLIFATIGLVLYFLGPTILGLVIFDPGVISLEVNDFVTKNAYVLLNINNQDYKKPIIDYNLQEFNETGYNIDTLDISINGFNLTLSDGSYYAVLAVIDQGLLKGAKQFTLNVTQETKTITVNATTTNETILNETVINVTIINATTGNETVVSAYYCNDVYDVYNSTGLVDDCTGGEESFCYNGSATCTDNCSDGLDNDGDGSVDNCNKFSIEDIGGVVKAAIFESGGFVTCGTIFVGQETIIPNGNDDFQIQDQLGMVVGLIDGSTGNLYLRGNFTEYSDHLVSNNSFQIQNRMNITKFWINSNGSAHSRLGYAENKCPP